MRKPVRILHTGDWHIGLESWKSGVTVDRTGEIENALDFMLENAKKNKIDLVVISGDISEHRSSPSAREYGMVLYYLREFSNIAPTVVVTGNHDWVGIAKLNIFSKKTNIHLINRFREDGRVSRREILALNGQRIRIFGIPYFDTRNFIKEVEPGAITGKSREALKMHLQEIEEHAKSDAWNILVGHIAIDGIIYSSEDVMDFSIQRSILPSVDYIALGHIHSQMEISGTRSKTWYSGAVVKNNFGEENSIVGFLIVDLQEGREPEVTPIRTPHKDLQTIKVSFRGNIEECISEIREQIGNKDSYIRVVLQVKENAVLPPLWASTIHKESEKIVKVEIEGSIPHARMESLKDISEDRDIEALFGKYLTEKEGLTQEESKKILDYFRKVRDEVVAENET